MTPASASLRRPEQFNIASHYDVMVQLDRDVHDDHDLAQSEVETAIDLIGHVPHRVFLPCFGTGRHIAALLARGVERIVGVDLSPKCVEKARDRFGDDPRVVLHVGDLTRWRTGERFGASILLGNSFGDIIDPDLLQRVTHGMVDPLAHDGTFLMDYIGRGYLDRCLEGKPVRWQARLHDIPVFDNRTPRYDSVSHVMSIDVRASHQTTGELIWIGGYQKAILTDAEVREHFRRVGIEMTSIGSATDLNSYYANHTGELGMIARSTWWVGRRS